MNMDAQELEWQIDDCVIWKVINAVGLPEGVECENLHSAIWMVQNGMHGCRSVSHRSGD